MKTIEEIILDYTSGKAGLPETNAMGVVND